jgi:DNA-binding NtrC family response regulator
MLARVPDMLARVIVVHDDVDTCQLALTALSAAGHEVVVFEDPMTALNAIDDADHSRVRLLITRVDFGLGNVNGVALARMLMFKQPNIKVLFVAREEYRHHTESVTGAFLPLPLDARALVDAVGRLLAEPDT